MLTETPDPTLAELLAAWEDVIVALRIRDGFSARAYERLRDALQACASSALCDRGHRGDAAGVSSMSRKIAGRHPRRDGTGV